MNQLTSKLAASLTKCGYKLVNNYFFDTIRFKAEHWEEKATAIGMNFREYNDGTVGISLYETTTEVQINDILKVFGAEKTSDVQPTIPASLIRQSAYLQHPVFHNYRSETEMLRYIHILESKDLSLNTSMIPLGSCTMKLNGTTEMAAVTWPEFGNIHPFAP